VSRFLLSLLTTIKGLSLSNWSKSETLSLGKCTGGKPDPPEGLGWGNLGFKSFRIGVFLGDDWDWEKLGRSH